MAMSTNTTAGATTAAMLICIMSQSAQSAVGTASTLIKVNPALENKACATELWGDTSKCRKKQITCKHVYLHVPVLYTIGNSECQ